MEDQGGVGDHVPVPEELSSLSSRTLDAEFVHKNARVLPEGFLIEFPAGWRI